MIHNPLEEQITVAAAQKLSGQGWKVISAHPPDGHGPFTLPMPSHSGLDIDRAGVHPDIVAVKRSGNRFRFDVLIVEVKLHQAELLRDAKKLELIARTNNAMRYIGFRLQAFGEYEGIDFDRWQECDVADLPILFGLAYRKEKTKTVRLPGTIHGFKVIELPIDL